MADATWKKCERMVARILGARRTPAGRPGEPDVRGRRLSVEVKHRKQLPRWLVAALEQAERAAGDGELAVCVLHERGMHYRDSLAVLRLRSLEELLSRLFGEVTADDAR